MWINIEFLKTFLRFAFLSGLGWLCDFVTYTILLTLLEVEPFIANFVSSYVGITFVYATSLRFVFNKQANRHGLFLGVYWLYQFTSILAYSTLLKLLVTSLNALDIYTIHTLIRENSGITAKIIITPFNLFTNFLFMKLLSHYMEEAKTYA